MLAKLFVLAAIVKSLAAEYIANDTQLLVDMQLAGEQVFNESFFYLFEGIQIHHYGCRFVIANKREVEGFSLNETITLSPLVPINQSMADAIKLVVEGEENEEIVEYWIDDGGDKTDFEVTMHINTSNLTTHMNLFYTEELADLTQLFNSPKSAKIKPIMRYQNEWPVQVYLSKTSNCLSEVGFEMPLEHTYRVFFKLSYFNKTTSAQFKRITLFEFDAKNMTKPEIVILLKSVEMVAMPMMNDLDRQFLVFVKNTSQVFLIDSLGSLGNNGKMSVSKLNLSVGREQLNLSMVRYMESQFLVFEARHEFKNSANKVVQNFFNYYVLHKMGEQLTVHTLQALKPMFRGVLVGSYFTLDMSQVLFDFLCPDLDEAEDETILSTLYFSPTAMAFEIFLENTKVSRKGDNHVNKSYHRVTTPTHVVEVFQAQKDLDKGVTNATVRVYSRASDAMLGQVHLNNSAPVAALKYIEVSNVILVKFANDTQYFKVDDASIAIELVVQRNDKFTEERFFANDGTLFFFAAQLICNSWVDKAEHQVFALEVRGIDTSLSSIYMFKGQDLRLNYNLVKGQTLILSKKKLCRQSFLDVKVESQTTVPIQDNMYMDPVKYSVTLPTHSLEQLFLFQHKKGKKLTSTLILDLDQKTSYYQLKGEKFEWKTNGADSRHISDISLLTPQFAFINISKNMYSLDIETIQERPLTTLGSYCLAVQKLRPRGIDDLMACITADKILFTYLSDRFSPQPLVLANLQKDVMAKLKDYSLIEVLYTMHMPNTLVLVTRSKKPPYANWFLVVDIMVSTSLTVSVRSDLEIKQLLPTESINKAHILDGWIILVTNSSSIYQYAISNMPGKSLLIVRYLRSVTLAAFFDAHTKVDIVLSNVVTLKQDGSSTFKKERLAVQRLILKVVITSSTFDNSQSTEVFENAIIMNHHLHVFDSFNWIFKPKQCSQLIMGPAYYTNDRKYSESIAFACVSDGKTRASKDPVQATVYRFKSYVPKFSIAEGHRTLDVLDGKADLRPNTTADFNLTCERQIAQSMYDKRHQGEGLKLQSKPYNMRLVYFDTNSPMRITAAAANQSLRLVRNESNSLLSVMYFSQKSSYTASIDQLFVGHVNQISLVCDSQIECEQGVITMTNPPTLKDLVRFSHKKEEHVFHFSVLITDRDMLLLMVGSDIEYTRLRLSDKQKTNALVRLGGLQTLCSEGESYKNYIMSVCLHSNFKNFIRVFDVTRDMTWFQMDIDTDAIRAINVIYANIEIEQDYLTILTYNPKFGRYLSGYLFKIVELSDNNSRPSDNTLKLNYLGETSMNDEVVHFKVYRETAEANKTTEKVYYWSTKRDNASHYRITVIGYQVNQIDSSIRLIKVCDQRSLSIGLKYQDDNDLEYLIDQGELVVLPREEGPYLDIVLSLPYADDFLIRMPQALLEDKGKSTADILDQVKFLRISNPFFGIKYDIPIKPMYQQDIYLMPTNHYGRTAVLIAFHLCAATRNKSEPIQEGSIDFSKLGVAQEASNYSSIYSYSVLKFDELIDSLHPAIYLSKRKAASSDEVTTVFVLFNDGSVRSLSISHRIQIQVNSTFVSSDKVKLIAKGPGNVQSVNVRLLDDDDGKTSLKVGLFHLSLIVIITTLVLCLTLFCRNSMASSRQPAETEAEPDESNKSGVDEQLIANNPANEDDESLD